MSLSVLNSYFLSLAIQNLITALILSSSDFKEKICVKLLGKRVSKGYLKLTIDLARKALNTLSDFYNKKIVEKTNNESEQMNQLLLLEFAGLFNGA